MATIERKKNSHFNKCRERKKKKRRGKLGLDIKKQELPRERRYRLEKVVSGLRFLFWFLWLD